MAQVFRFLPLTSGTWLLVSICCGHLKGGPVTSGWKPNLAAPPLSPSPPLYQIFFKCGKWNKIEIQQQQQKLFHSKPFIS